MDLTRIAIIGECMVELKRVNNKLEQGFGGDTLNTAVYLSRLTRHLGVETSYITGLGLDAFSRDMLSNWKQEQINTKMVYQLDDKLPGMYAIETAEDGERSFSYWRNDAAAKYWLREHDQASLIQQLSRQSAIYLSGISLAILPNDYREKLLSILTQCRENGVSIIFDNNFRPALWENIDTAKYWYQAILQITSIAFLTYDDEALLWSDKNEQDAISRSQGFGIEEIVMKRGADECWVVTGDDTLAVAANKIDQVIDTTAAGDSFSAGYLAKRLLGGSCRESALFGHTLAGTVIQHPGAIIPLAAMPNIKGTKYENA